MKKLYIIVFVLLCLLHGNALADEYDGYISFICERTTIGQGLVVEPTHVGFYKTDTLASIIERALGDKSTHTGTLKDYYLSGVRDGGVPVGWTQTDIPRDILNAIEDVDTRENASILGEFDYSSYGGWMFFVDNMCSNVGANSIKYANSVSTDGNTFTDGTVVRLMFTVYGYGRDLGIDWGYYNFDTTNSFQNRDALIRLCANCSDKNRRAYTNAVAILSKWQISDGELNGAINALNLDYSISYDNLVTLNAKLNSNTITAYAFLVETDNADNIVDIKLGVIDTNGITLSYDYNQENTYKAIFVNGQSFAPIN